MAGSGNMLEAVFPGLALGGYRVTSPANRRHNCVAWAAGDSENWWWPSANLEDEFWPPSVKREATLAAFKDAFSTLGYEPCANPESEPDYERIVIYCDGLGKPTHVARQLPGGRWTSKLGRGEDIEHELKGLEGDVYGRVAVLMRRRRESRASAS
jgi:hypothetical protein